MKSVMLCKLVVHFRVLSSHSRVYTSELIMVDFWYHNLSFRVDNQPAKPCMHCKTCYHVSMWPHHFIHVASLSSSLYTCVLITTCMCPHHYIHMCLIILITIYMCPHHYIHMCLIILITMCLINILIMHVASSLHACGHACSLITTHMVGELDMPSFDSEVNM